MSTLQVLSILSPLCAGAVCGYVTGIWGERRGWGLLQRLGAAVALWIAIAPLILSAARPA